MTTTTRTCRACSTRLANGLVDDRHPLCRLDPPPTAAEIRAALALLDDVLGIEVLGGIQLAADEGPDIANRSHVNDPDHRAHPPDQLEE